MKNTRWSSDDLKKLGLVQNEKGDYVKVSSLVAKKVDKFPSPYAHGYTTLQQANNIMAANPVPVYQQPEGNKKVRNATKSIVNGVKFDSNLEKYMHGLLTGAQIDFQFQKQYILQQKFRYGTEAIRAISLTVDFFLPRYNMIVDTKGYQTQQGAMRYKMLKWHLKNNPERIGDFNPPRIELPSTKKECELLLNRLLYG